MLGQRLDDLAVDRDVAKQRGAGNVAIPQPMMDKLIVPFALAGLDIHRD